MKIVLKQDKKSIRYSFRSMASTPCPIDRYNSWVLPGFWDSFLARFLLHVSGIGSVFLEVSLLSNLYCHLGCFKKIFFLSFTLKRTFFSEFFIMKKEPNFSQAKSRKTIIFYFLFWLNYKEKNTEICAQSNFLNFLFQLF